MKKIPILFTVVLLISCRFFAQTATAQLQSGPMVGYSDMREVLLWAQTQKPAKVKFMFWEQGNGTKKMSSDEVNTDKKTAFVARITVDGLYPGKKYDYEVWIDNKKVSVAYPLTFQTQALWQYRTDPPAFKFAFGSCVYVADQEFDRPGRSYGGENEIFTAIAAQKPDFMLWGGDNLYLREVDWSSRSGVLYRNTHTRSLAEMQPLLGAAHHYAIWDDHDYGPNDCDRSYWGKNWTSEAFRLFWGNPNYAFEGACTGTFEWADVQFFLLDDRWFRAPNDDKTAGKDYFGAQQIQWLLDNLKTSRAPFKFIVTGGQVINPSAVFENYVTYPDERTKFLSAISEAKIPGVVFLTGDRHHTVVNKLERAGSYPLYDFTISPITSGPGKPVKEEENNVIVEGTLVPNKRNFATFDVSGPRTDRSLKVTVFDAKGTEIWNKELKASALKEPKQ